MIHADPDRAACAGLGDIFTSPLLFDHRIAAPYCLGDQDRPACPLLEACKQQTPDAAGYHDGTYAAVLYRNGKEIGRHGKLGKRRAAA